jgi:hypothetical protein
VRLVSGKAYGWIIWQRNYLVRQEKQLNLKFRICSFNPESALVWNMLSIGAGSSTGKSRDNKKFRWIMN